MPFGETISNNYGTHGQGSSSSSSSSSGSNPSHAPQNTPLRSRGSSSNNNNSQSNGDFLFRHPHSSFDDFPYPPYSELPFTSMRRRKQQNGNTFVKWAMRAVLASPVVVLVVWSIGAMLFSNKVVHSTNGGGSSHNINNNSKATNASKRRLPHAPPLPKQHFQQEQPPQQMPQFFQPYMMAPQQQQQQMMMMQQMQPQVQQQMMQPGIYGASQNGAMAAMGYMAAQPQQVQAMMAQQPGVMQQDPVMAASSPLVSNLYGDAANTVVEATPRAATTLEGQPRASTEGVVVQPPEPVEEAAPEKSKRPAVDLKPHQLLRAEEPLPAATSTGVLYYDPRQAVGASGDLILPPLVYDAAGNPIDISALQGKQVLMEAPVLGASAAEEEMPKAQLSMPSIPSAADIPWGESTAQDQSIIVSTVAVMALLVGALSARRLRSRSLLSACIENESLEDDVAFDAAYTTSTIVGNHVSTHPDSSYNTFGGGWKGDLEKFDV